MLESRLSSWILRLITRTPNENMKTAGKPVVLFDGQCNFCRSQIDILRRLDGKHRLDFVSLHDPTVTERFPDLSFEQLMDQMWIVSPEGDRFGGAYAVRYLTRKLPILWPIAPLMFIPGSMKLWQFLYKQIAKHRYRIAGRNCGNTGTCSLHYPSPLPPSKPAQ
jgi:predicted DCC family thiol-disulfide oxidoreductase YuxK